MSTLGESTNAYYRFHSRIYDLTRWSFLYGRQALVREVVARRPRRVLEVGCGTGRILIAVKRALPDAACLGVDASGDMLRMARRKSAAKDIRWLQGSYPSAEVDAAIAEAGPPDAIVFSYALSMVNPGYERCLEAAHRAVAPQGVVCVLDFHRSPFAGFRRWMAMNHVRMEGQLLAAVAQSGELALHRERAGLLGLWRYSLLVSRPRASLS